MANPILGEAGSIPSASAPYILNTEYGTPSAGIHRTKLTLTNFPVLTADEAGVCGWGGGQIYDFPEGMIAVLGASQSLAVNKTVATGVISDTFDGDVALGTSKATNVAAFIAGAQNVIASTAMPQAVAGATTANGVSLAAITALTDSSGGTASDTTIAALTDGTTYANDVAAIRNNLATIAAKLNSLIARGTGAKVLGYDGSTTAADLYLNFLIDDGDQNIGSATPYLYVTGTIDITWIHLGDK